MFDDEGNEEVCDKCGCLLSNCACGDGHEDDDEDEDDDEL